MTYRWAPALVLTLGSILLLGVASQRTLPLERPLQAVIPMEIAGFLGKEMGIGDSEAEVAGFDDYLFRVYESPDTESQIPWFSLYVGYYESQAQGETIHSPKNCLPGAGWEALSSQTMGVEVGGQEETVNFYLLQNEDERALVLYWYQGRGRVAHNEYLVKLNLVRDAALRRRSDEALVRLVVPWSEDEDEIQEFARNVTKEVIPAVEAALPVS